MAVPPRPAGRMLDTEVQGKGRGSSSPSAKYKRMAAEPQRSTSPNMSGRGSSFSSIRENDSDLTQVFTHSKVSSYSQLPEDAVDDDSAAAASANMVEAVKFFPPRTQPNSRLHGSWFPAHSFKGWKQIDVKGRLASKSFSDLHMLTLGWTNSKPLPPPGPPPAKAPGDALVERLPVELLSSIINLLVLDIPPNGISRRNVDLMSLLLTSKTLHTATLTALYNRVTIPHSRIFKKFLNHIKAHPSLGTIVRRLDFSHFNPAVLFTSDSERMGAVNLTRDTLLQCLQLTPYLQEFLGQEHIQEDIDTHVLRKLITGLSSLQALDLCGCSSKEFRAAFELLIQQGDLPEELSIIRLSLHKCITLPPSVFEAILPRLPNLTHLDVAGTRITDKALSLIPVTAKITHLNLAKCTLLSAPGVIDFLSSHPAVTKTLTFLSLAADARSHELLEADDVTELLPLLPKTLKSLSLKGTKMDASHIKDLLPMTKYLQELSLGRGLTMQAIEKLFVPDDTQSIEDQLEWIPHTLKYIDLSDMFYGDLNVSHLYNNAAILTRHTAPLAVIEVSQDVFKRITKSQGPLTRSGWRNSELGVRCWLVRNADPAAPRDDGRRSWKMGAESWGMRKIPMARADVGGMYGSYMFARKL